jgi:hypothetical protein
VRHNFQLPRWPFASKLWNPKPTVKKDQDEKDKEVTDEELIEDELAGAAAGLAKRPMAIERDFVAEEAFYHILMKRSALQEVRVHALIDREHN